MAIGIWKFIYNRQATNIHLETHHFMFNLKKKTNLLCKLIFNCKIKKWKFKKVVNKEKRFDNYIITSNIQT